MDEQIARAEQIARETYDEIARYIHQIQAGPLAGAGVSEERTDEVLALLKRDLAALAASGIELDALLQRVRELRRELASLGPLDDVTVERTRLLKQLSGELSRLAGINLDFLSILSAARQHTR